MFLHLGYQKCFFFHKLHVDLPGRSSRRLPQYFMNLNSAPRLLLRARLVDHKCPCTEWSSIRYWEQGHLWSTSLIRRARKFLVALTCGVKLLTVNFLYIFSAFEKVTKPRPSFISSDVSCIIYCLFPLHSLQDLGFASSCWFLLVSIA